MKTEQQPTTTTTTTTSRRRHWRRRASAALALTTLAAAGIAVTANPASAAGWASGTLSMRPGHDAFHTEMTVIGSFEMSQEEARLVIASRPLITLQFMGDDPRWDDLLAVDYISANSGQPTYLSITDKGLSLYSRIDVENEYLNEDVEGRDEIYVKVRLSTRPPNSNSTDRTIARFNTYPVYGYF